MPARKDYLQEVQKFISSQYWYSGWRITAGVMVPLIVFISLDLMAVAVPFLWGALFVSLTDTPGPIKHRRNGMLAAIALNTIVVLLTGLTKEYQALLITQIVVLGFLLTMLAVYGARAGAVGSLTLVVMLLNLLSINTGYNTVTGAALIAGGGTWYMLFSLMLHGIRPYRQVEQALGEHLIIIGDYIRARAAFYREGTNLTQCFDRVMKTQSEVRTIQDQTQELLFRTRRAVADASPKSRSLMMIYLDSLDLFEETMYSYRDYKDIHDALGNTGLLNRYYGLILELAAAVEHVGISVQMGRPVRNKLDFSARVSELDQLTTESLGKSTVEGSSRNLESLKKILNNVVDITNRINRLILYTRMEGNHETDYETAHKISRLAATQPIRFKVLWENMTLKSEVFRHAIRLTLAIVAGYVVSMALSLDHNYWVMLTIVTILRPAYVLTKKRNIERVAGTLLGVAVVSALLWFISNTTALMVILVLCMLIGYSLLRVHYFTFVVFLTIFLVISLYFLAPHNFGLLIRERLIDTVVGSVIAFIAARFFFPLWGHHALQEAMRKMLDANRQYFLQAWIVAKSGEPEPPAYTLARQNAIVSLTNLSDKFQRMLSEPEQSAQASRIHQFVIANHMLTGHIAALSDEPLSADGNNNDALEEISRAITYELQCAEDNLRDKRALTDLQESTMPSIENQSLEQLSMTYGLAREIRKITARLSQGLS